MKVDLADYDKACKDYYAHWQLLDRTLYALCAEHPGHADAADINAKLWIIGRTFASGIERAVPSTGAQGGSLARVRKQLLKHSEEVEDIFAALRTVAEPLDRDRLKLIVAQHGRFDKLLRKITRKHRSARSFASKYMHFHCPAVPIYDGLSTARLTKLVRWHRDLKVSKAGKHDDEWYRCHVQRLFALYEHLRKNRPRVSVRLVDVFLLW